MSTKNLTVRTPELQAGDTITGGVTDAGLSLKITSIRRLTATEDYWQIGVEGLDYINAHDNKQWQIVREVPDPPAYTPRTVALIHGVPYMRDNEGAWHYVVTPGTALGDPQPGGMGRARVSDAGIESLLEISDNKILFGGRA